METARGCSCFFSTNAKLCVDCCKVSIGKQEQCDRLAIRVLTQGRRIKRGGGGGHIPPVLANHSLEEKVKGH